MNQTLRAALKGSTPPPWLTSPDHSAWEKVFAKGQRRKWENGDMLYRYGDRAEELVLVLEGIVGIRALGLSGVQRTIGNLGPGCVLGDAAFFNDGVYRHGIQCIVPCEGVLFSRAVVMEEILPEHPDLTRYILHNLATKSYMMSTQLEAASFMSSEQQLAHFLWHLWLEQEEDSGMYHCIAAISFGQLGEMLGMHRVTVTRLMGTLKRDGVISMQPGIRVENPEELERLFNGS